MTSSEIAAIVTPLLVIIAAIVQQWQSRKIKAQVDVVHDLSNSAMGLQLQTAVGFAQRLYDEHQKPEDLVVLERTKALLADHQAKQSVVDAKKAPLPTTPPKPTV